MSTPFFERIHPRPAFWMRWGLYALLLGGFYYVQSKHRFVLLFPFEFVFPVIVASWWDGRAGGYTLTALSTIHTAMVSAWPQTATRLVALAMLIELVCYTTKIARRVRVLEGLLPICMHCHRIRKDDGQWVRFEEYVYAHSEATFSHGICPTCMK